MIPLQKSSLSISARLKLNVFSQLNISLKQELTLSLATKHTSQQKGQK